MSLDPFAWRAREARLQQLFRKFACHKEGCAAGLIRGALCSCDYFAALQEVEGRALLGGDSGCELKTEPIF